MVSNTMRLKLCYLKTIDILHPRHHPEIMGHILQNNQRHKYVCMRLYEYENETEKRYPKSNTLSSVYEKVK